MHPEPSAVVDLTSVIAGVTEPWSPLTVALLNDYTVNTGDTPSDLTTVRRVL